MSERQSSDHHQNKTPRHDILLHQKEKEIGDVLLEIGGVSEKTGLGESTIRRQMREGRFPRPDTSIGRVKYWKEGTIDHHVRRSLRNWGAKKPKYPEPSPSSEESIDPWQGLNTWRGLKEGTEDLKFKDPVLNFAWLTLTGSIGEAKKKELLQALFKE